MMGPFVICTVPSRVGLRTNLPAAAWTLAAENDRLGRVVSARTLWRTHVNTGTIVPARVTGRRRPKGQRGDTESIESMYAEYQKRGGKVHPNGPLQTKPWGTKEFGAIDPNGACVTFQE